MSFFVLGALCASWHFFQGDEQVFARIDAAMMQASQSAISTGLSLAGTLCLWMGFFEIAERSGAMQGLARIMSPLLRRLLPDVPVEHPAMSAISMNLAANMLGLDQAATPFGLRAMQELQQLNERAEVASRSQIMFLMLNCNALTLLPLSIFAYRAAAGAHDPALVFLPIVISSLLGLSWAIALTLFVQGQRIDRLLLGIALGVVAMMACLAWIDRQAAWSARLAHGSSLFGNALLLGLMVALLLSAQRRQVEVYDSFIVGASRGLQTTLRLLPYLVGMWVALAVFRASGFFDLLLSLLQGALQWMHVSQRFVPALPVILMKPFSGGGARVLLLETLQRVGVDSFAGRVAAVVQGSTETIFYVVTVYLGSVGIRRGSYALSLGLFTEACGALLAVLVCYVVFPA